MDRLSQGVRRGPAYATLRALTVCLLFASVVGLCTAPTETTMGHAQRVLYVHVSVAWLGLLGFLATAGTGLMYLWRRSLEWDHWSQSAAEVGWLCCSLTLVTGSLWARTAWGTWWTWEPRLATTFILWALYAGYFLLRGSLEDRHRRARMAAILATVGALDVPLVALATRWFRGIHPVAPEMEPSMRAVLLVTAAGFLSLMVLLLLERRNQIRLEVGVERLIDAAASQAPS